MPAIDPNSLPHDIDVLQKIVVELCERLQHESSEKNKYRSLLRELLDAQRNRKSEQLSKEQLALFEELWKASDPEAAEEEASEPDADREQDTSEDPPQANKRGGRQPLARNVIRERIVHDLPEAEKHCSCCGKDLRLFDEEISERYEYIPASIKVIEDVRRKYACDCTVKTADKPAQPIEKSTAGASMLAHVIVSKFADHQPLHRQEKMLEREGVRISRKTMGDGAGRRTVPALVSIFQESAVRFQSDRNRRYRREGARPEVVICADGPHLAVLGRCPPSSGCPSLHAHARTRRSGEISGGISRIPAGRRLLRLRCLFQTRARADRGRVHDARAQVFL